MTKPTIQAQRDELTREATGLRRKWDRLRQQARVDERRLNAIEAALRRLDFIELVGKPNAVKLRHRERPGSRYARLNDLTGTVLSVRRKLAVVDFGDSGKLSPSSSGRWAIPVGELLPAELPQGRVL